MPMLPLINCRYDLLMAAFKLYGELNAVTHERRVPLSRLHSNTTAPSQNARVGLR
jgi:hypothetical protein